AAAEATRHVITEKPMAISLAQADALVHACDAAGVNLFVVKQNRLNPPVQLLKRAVDKGRFGRIYMANVTVRWQRPQEYYDAEPGSVKIGGTAVNRVEHWTFADYDDDDKLLDSANTNPPNVYGFGHEGYYRNVVAVLRGQASPETDGRAGRKSLELILGMYAS